MAGNTGERSTDSPSDGRRSRPSLIGWIAFGTIVASLWILLHPTTGIVHDTRLYTLLALARLYPAELGNDVFLRFGSQGDFTLFTPIYAAAIRSLGVEAAAGLLTALCLAGWVGAVVAVARSLAIVPAALAVALVLVVPGDYGIHGFLSYGESFITPRLPGEALSLAAVAAWLAHRRALATLLLGGAALLHPLIALPAGLIIAAHDVGPRIRHAGLLLVAAAAAIGAALALATWAPVGPIRLFDQAWLDIVQQRAPYLFPHLWSRSEWGTVVWPIALAWISSQCVDQPDQRRLLQAAALVAAAGIVLSMIASSALPVVGVTQGQPWRWVWPCKLLAVMLLPSAMPVLWREGQAGRSVSLLLAAGWIMSAVAGVWLSLAGLLLWFTRRRISTDLNRAVQVASIVALAVAITWLLATRVPIASAQLQIGGVASFVLELATGGMIPLAVGCLAWWMATMSGRLAGSLIAIAAVLLIVPALEIAETAAQSDYPVARETALARWRAAIPDGHEVLWPEDPSAAWVLLRRPSYISKVQSAGTVFSRDAALELRRRAHALSGAIPVVELLGAPGTGGTNPVWSTRALKEACADPALAFVVAPQDLSMAEAAPPVATGNGPEAGLPLHLYACREYR